MSAVKVCELVKYTKHIVGKWKGAVERNTFSTNILKRRPTITLEK